VNLQRICTLLAMTGLLAMSDAGGQLPNDGNNPPIGAVHGLFGAVSVRLKAGDFAPDIEFTKVLRPTDGSRSSAEFSGKTTVLVFFPLISQNPQHVAGESQFNSHSLTASPANASCSLQTALSNCPTGDFGDTRPLRDGQSR
jgi:hypothetical protein